MTGRGLELRPDGSIAEGLALIRKAVDEAKVELTLLRRQMGNDPN